MPSNNLVVDVSSINGMISKTDKMWEEASKGKYYLLQPGTTGVWASPLDVSTATKDFKIEARVDRSANGWRGWGTRVLFKTIPLTNSFSQRPVISATFDGSVRNVSVTIDVTGPKSVTVYLHNPSSTWPRSATFLVHIIAIGC